MTCGEKSTFRAAGLAGLFLAALVLLTLASGAWAGTRTGGGYLIQQDVLSSGGGRVTYDGFAVNGVVGQQTGAKSEAGGYVLWHGVPGPVAGAIAPMNATRAFKYFKYASPGTIDVTISILSYSGGGALSSVSLQDTIPTGWTFNTMVAETPALSTRPSSGATGTVTFGWGSVPSFPATITYRLNVPSGQSGIKTFTGNVAYVAGGVSYNDAIGPLTTIAQRLYHSADYNPANYKIGLPELLRVIQFYNSGGYHVDTTTADGFAPSAGSHEAAPHDADYTPQNWLIGLPELLRIIQFYNSSGYHVSEGTADGFAPGP